MFDIEKARAKGMSEQAIAIMQRINDNTVKRESCKYHDFKEIRAGKYKCKNCGCEENVEYVLGYQDGLLHCANAMEEQK